MRLTNKLFEYLYMPVCRAYARRFINDEPADELMRRLLIPYFLFVHRYWPDFKNPRSFSEKIFHRMLYCRNPLLTLVSDKLLVRDYVARKVGYKYLIPLLWQGDNPEDIPFDDLPQKFVIKASHGCGYNIVVHDKARLHKGTMQQRLKYWLSEDFSQDTFMGISWAYKNIKPTLLIENFLDDNKAAPVDYKFFCFEGRAEFIQVSFDRYGDASERILNRNFEPLNVWNGLKLYNEKIIKPENYDELVHLSDKLSREFKSIRVDLYSVGGRAYFGELTCYHAGGMARFIPREYDFIFGEKWRI